MMDYSGSLEPDLEKEIERRGGMKVFLHNLQRHRQFQEEQNRIARLVYSMHNQQMPLSVIISNIKSNIIADPFLKSLIEEKYRSFDLQKKNAIINKNTFLRCLVSFIVTTMVGSAVWGFAVLYFGSYSYILLPILSLIIMLLTQIFAGKTTSNVLVFSTGFLSILTSYFSGFILLPYIT